MRELHVSPRRLDSTDSFTLIELIVVIAVVAILLAVAAPSFLGYAARAHDSVARQQLAVGYRAAKALAAPHENHFTHADCQVVTCLTAGIQRSEPQLNVGHAPTVSDVAGACQPGTVYVLTDEQQPEGRYTHATNLKLATLSKSGKLFTLTVTAGGAPVIREPVVAASGDCDLIKLPDGGVPPSLEGDPNVGETLVVNPGSNWAGPRPWTFSYQWQRCDSDGRSCSNIRGATDSQRTVTLDDVSFTLRATVTVTSPAGTATQPTNRTPEVQYPVPTNTGRPELSGQLIAGRTITTSNGTWQHSPTRYQYQWQSCSDEQPESCEDIAGATGRTFTLRAADIGRRVRSSVRAVNAGGVSAAAHSAISAEISAPVPENITPPQLSGGSTVGQTLTATSGTWTESPTGYSYQWQRCADSSGTSCTNISGATGNRYTVTSTDLDRMLRVQVTASNEYGPGRPARSDTTRAVNTQRSVSLELTENGPMAWACHYCSRGLISAFQGDPTAYAYTEHAGTYAIAYTGAFLNAGEAITSATLHFHWQINDSFGQMGAQLADGDGVPLASTALGAGGWQWGQITWNGAPRTTSQLEARFDAHSASPYRGGYLYVDRTYITVTIVRTQP